MFTKVPENTLHKWCPMMHTEEFQAHILLLSQPLE
jgi:hypothetical protein